MKKDKTPLYLQTLAYAKEHGEAKECYASFRQNIACRDAIDQAITEHFQENRLSERAVEQVVRAFPYDRIFYVLANTVQRMEYDGRYSRRNKEWARTFPACKSEGDYGRDLGMELISHSHPALLDLFLTLARQEHLISLPLKRADIKAEAENLLRQFRNLREPNSSDGAHFDAGISPVFMKRAKPKDLERLAAMLPFPSFTISKPEGCREAVALISAEEDRSQKLRLRKPSNKRDG